MGHLTDEDRDEITRLFGYVPEPEPLQHMLLAVERIVTRHRRAAWAEGGGYVSRYGYDPDDNPYREGNNA